MRKREGPVNLRKAGSENHGQLTRISLIYTNTTTPCCGVTIFCFPQTGSDLLRLTQIWSEEPASAPGLRIAAVSHLRDRPTRTKGLEPLQRNKARFYWVFLKSDP